MITIKVAYRRNNEEYWTYLEKEVEDTASIDGIVVSTDDLLKHAKKLIVDSEIILGGNK